MADASRIDKVILLFPDHFKKSKLPFATTRRAFETVFGEVMVSEPDVEFLLRTRNLVEELDLFGSDHGIGAVLPFIKHFLPSVPIVPIAISIDSRRDQWDALAARLRRMVDTGTFIIQSTDFSHYLAPFQAVQRDQEVLNILAADSLESVARLRQLQQTDLRGSQYLQMRLQRDVFHARPIALFNSNAEAYLRHSSAQTTSYVVQIFASQTEARIGSDQPGSKVYCFAGDTFFGRGMLPVLINKARAERVRHELQSALNGCRLIVNLTGVIVPELPVNLDRLILAMPSQPTLEWLKALNVVAVDLANNHTQDLGREPFDAMVEMLSGAGMKVLKHGDIIDLGSFRLAALTDIDNRTGRLEGVIGPDDIEQIARSTAKPPLFVLVNWGLDYEFKPGTRELDLTKSLFNAASSLIIGVHPHVAAAKLDLTDDGQGIGIYSLGNFIFDQNSRIASGSVLEVRVFDEGTYFARLVPLPNIFDNGLGSERLSAPLESAAGNIKGPPSAKLLGCRQRVELPAEICARMILAPKDRARIRSSRLELAARAISLASEPGNCCDRVKTCIAAPISSLGPQILRSHPHPIRPETSPAVSRLKTAKRAY